MTQIARGMLTAFVLMAFALSIIALARGAPDKKTFTDQAIVSVSVAPTVANVPPMTNGFDVIQNYSTAYSRFASASVFADTSAVTGLSTTGDESRRSAPQPLVVLLA